MIHQDGAPVVVGVDGSDESLVAVDLAARMAADRSRALRVVHAFIWPELRAPLGPYEGGPAEGGLANEAKSIVDAAVSRARDSGRDLTVTGDVVVGAPATVLIAEARSAAMVVLGDRGLGGFSGLLIGSVAIQVSAHASCAVVVAKGDIGRAADVVVGVDGSSEAALALRFGLEEASLRGVGLRALHAFRHPATGKDEENLPLIYDADQVREQGATLLAAAVAQCGEHYPQVTIKQDLVRERAAHALIRASASAGCVVVGSRGRGGFLGLVLGSVSHAVLHHAQCPVAIVR